MSNIWDGPWAVKFSESQKPNPGAFAYRYVDRRRTDFYTDVDGEARPGKQYVEIALETFDVLAYTPKGFWIMDYNDRKFINHSWRKKYAHLNLEEARNSFRRRKEVQYKRLDQQLDHCQQVLDSINNDKWSGRCAHSAFKLKRVLA